MNARWLAIALLLGPGIAAPTELGRMFFTPAQRATLDSARKQNVQMAISTENTDLPPVPQNVSVNGLVRSSDGKTTVWINNRPVTDTHAGVIDVTPAKNDNRVRLSVPNSGRSVELKVGQTVELTSGRIAEGYSRAVPPKAVDKSAAGSAAPADKAGLNSPPVKREDTTTTRAQEPGAAYDAAPNPTAESK